MASVGISEFTFGFAFLFEQVKAKWPRLKAAPILPSLQKEHHAGWDARLPVTGTAFYYQFKVSEYLTRGNAKFIKNGTYTSPYYRMGLHRRYRNQQHRRLRAHCLVSPNTYYVAPEFDSLEDFNAAFLSRQLVARSRLFPLTKCKNINDGKQHYITFQTGHRRWKQHSGPCQRL